MTATSSQIAIWRFSTAPEELKSLCNAGKAPAWLAVVPRALRGTAVDRFLQKCIREMAPKRFETATKDVVYSGGEPPVIRRKPGGRGLAAKSVHGRKVAATAVALPR